jgi:hypothetical protein
MRFALGAAKRVLLDGNTTWDGAAKPAADPWNQVMARLQLQVDLSLNSPVVSGDGVNAVVFSSNIFGTAFGARTLAVTVNRSSASTMIEADILFNNAQTFDSYRGPLRLDQGEYISDIRRVMIHELGHVIGLDHPDTNGQHVDAIMNSVESNRDTLSADDIAGARALYGTPGERVAPNRDDFNRDGFPDYLLANRTTRQTAIWHLQGNTFVDGVYGRSVPVGWLVACVADMNGDGYPDYLVVNLSTHETAIWFLNDAEFISGRMGPTLPPGWNLVAATDVNGDGKPDCVLFNTTTRQTAVWFLDGTSKSGDAEGPTLPSGWTLADVNDLNGDGQPDLLLLHVITHRTAIWYLNGTEFAGSVYGPTLPPSWTLRGSADFNRDGQPDYLLFNAGTRQTAIWLLNRATFVRGVFGPTLPADYNLAAP